MEEAHERLIKIIKLIEVHYGRVKITPNLHLSLHLCDCSNDFGPLYAFWYFSFERMNGILGSLPTSNRQIEPEIMRQIMNDNQIEDIINELERFLLNAKNIQELTITGCEPFPGEMLKPSSEAIMTESMLELMVAFYNASYIEMYKFRKPADEIIQDSITIRVKINQFGRCQISSKVFGSAMSVRHTKSSCVLAKFITSDGEVDSYPGQIQYFFKHTVDLPNGQMEHNLAYICWYRPASTNIIFILMMKMRAVTSSCGNLNFMMKAVIFYYGFVSFVDLYYQNIKFLLRVMLLNIWRLIQLIANSKFVNN
ncbi:hypothetical protein GLOIN_2v1775288 [Rhizophagus irregularis DAOM 181602=DAOM 197198]|nr:hypothetical protein GLOIN_2v1775288 [Rhizophagus irregularis DAOM 181602=DAOM 197198]